MNLIQVKRRGRVLSRANFGCLRGVHTLNVTWGCEFACVYCYARGYPGAPPAGEVRVYSNLPEKLAAELDNPRRRAPVRWVSFNTASDSFQTHPEILDTAYRAMEVLLERGIGFSFLTKGRIPSRFVDLFARAPGLVGARIGLVSVNPAYLALFEPHAAPVRDRLENIDALRKIGVSVEVRVDPIIPFLTDDEGSILALFETLASRGVRKITMSYLHLRPAIVEQLGRELPATAYSLLLACFHGRPWSTVGSSTRSKLIPLSLRRNGYRRFQALAQHFGLTPLICACKNPDMTAQSCTMEPARIRSTRAHGPRQLALFPC